MKDDRSKVPFSSAWLAANPPVPPVRKNIVPRPANTPPAVPVPSTCVHRGEAIPPAEALRLGLGTVRVYFPCAVGKTLNAAKVPGYVCGCAGCGPSCDGYSAGDSDEGD